MAENGSVIEKSSLLTCPHCRAGEDGSILGLFWDTSENSWRCLTCGHRSFEQKKRSYAELLDEMLWDQVLASFEQEKEQEHPWDEEVDYEDGLGPLFPIAYPLG